MFTGLIEATGVVSRLVRRAEGARLHVRATFAGELKRGESVAVDGVCVTVADVGRDVFEADLVSTTLGLTTLGSLGTGDEVNLERAVRLGDRLGGHMVSGHVDCVAVVVRFTPGPSGAHLEVELPGGEERHAVERGSVAVDGVSLTVASVDGPRVSVALIPETLSATKASSYRAGDRVNVETDMIAKYVERLLRGGEEHAAGADTSGLTEERLRELGFLGKRNG